MNRLNHSYNLKYLHQVVEYGRIIGAEHALMINGWLYLYYKRGDKVSKFCAYNYDTADQEKMMWKNSFNTSVKRVYEFYKDLGWKCDLIKIDDIVLEPMVEDDLEPKHED